MNTSDPFFGDPDQWETVVRVIMLTVGPLPLLLWAYGLVQRTVVWERHLRLLGYRGQGRYRPPPLEAGHLVCDPGLLNVLDTVIGG